LASPLAVGMEVTIYNPTFDNAERARRRWRERSLPRWQPTPNNANIGPLAAVATPAGTRSLT
jgi:hypothetical protein